MFIKQGLTAICFAAGLALFAPSGMADQHHGASMTTQGHGGGATSHGGMTGHEGVMGRDMGKRHDKIMRRHMRSESRAGRRHHRGARSGHRVKPISHLTVEDVRHHFEHRLARRGNNRLKIGEVKKIDDDTITADIVTVDDSLVRRMKVDRHSGRISRD